MSANFRLNGRGAERRARAAATPTRHSSYEIMKNGFAARPANRPWTSAAHQAG